MGVSNPFTPSFGGMPEHFFGRSEHISMVCEALGDSYSPNRVLFFTGSRGCGKTALLERLSQVALAENWYVVDVHSAHVAEELKARMVGSGFDASLQAAPKVSMPGGISVSLGSAVAGAGQAADLTDALLARCSALTGQRGVFVSVDEIQKISPDDMEQVCAAVQMARRKGLPVALMMAGLPGSKERVASYEGCTFMERAQEVKIGSLRISETVDAFEQLLYLSPDIEIKDGVIWEMASFSQGYPYLMQLVGYHLVRLVRELYPVGVPVARVDHVKDAEVAAYEAYRRDVLSPSLRGIGPEMHAYLTAMALLLDDDGNASTGAVAQQCGKTLSQLSVCRDALIKRRLISASGRGLVRYALPHLSRYFLASAQEDVDDPEDQWPIR